jgi:hypothetical protein
MVGIGWIMLGVGFVIGFICGGSKLWKCIVFGFHCMFDKDWSDYHDIDGD